MMTSRSTMRLTAWALPLALSVACGDDNTGDDGANTTNAGTSDATDTETPDTSTPTSGTTAPPGTTSGPDATSSTGEPDPDSSSGGAVDESMVRVMHLGVRAPGVDVFANGEGPAFSGLEFRGSTEYAAVPSGDYTFEVVVAGGAPRDAVLAPMLTLEADTKYTAVAIGDLEGTDGAPDLQAIALVDDDADIDAANVHVTVIHAAPAVGQVDVWEISDPMNPVELLADVDFAASATLPDIPAGPLEIGIDVDDDMTPDVTFSVDTTPLAGTQVNVYANNDDAGDVALVAQLPDGTVLTIPAN